MCLIKRVLRQRNIEMVLVVSLFGAIAILPSYAAQPQPWDAAADEAAANREMDFDTGMADAEQQGSAQGEVASVNNGSQTISLKEDEYDTGQPTISMYYINSDTTFEGVGSLSGISVGDTVSMDYFIYKNRNTADNIVLEKKSYSSDSGDIQSSVPKVLVD